MPAFEGIRFRRNFGKAAALSGRLRNGHTGRNRLDTSTPTCRTTRTRSHGSSRALRIRVSTSSAAGSKCGTTRGTRSSRAASSTVMVSRLADRRETCTTTTAASRRTGRESCGASASTANCTASSRCWRRRKGFKVGEIAVGHRAAKFGRSKFGVASASSRASSTCSACGSLTGSATGRMHLHSARPGLHRGFADRRILACLLRAVRLGRQPLYLGSEPFLPLPRSLVVHLRDVGHAASARASR